MSDAIYEYPLMLTSQFYYCSMPLRLDSHRGCPSRCKYCFVSSRNGNYYSKQQYLDPRFLERIFLAAFEKNEEPRNVLIECLRQRVPLHFGGMSDPFLTTGLGMKCTLAAMKILKRYNYPTLISTKSAIIHNSAVTDMIVASSCFAVQMSFGTMSDKIAAHLEPNAPPPSERLKGARELLKAGAWVSCRLQPYFPTSNFEDTFNAVKTNGFKHLTLEHFKMPFDKKIDLEELSRIVGCKLNRYFSERGLVRRGREFEMTDDIRLESISRFKSKCRQYSIPIGVADNGLQHLGTSPCCCGIDKLKGFENWFKHNLAVAVSRSENEVKYNAIAKEWLPKKSISRMINSKTRLRNVENTIANHLKEHWQNNRQFSPEMFYGVVAEKKKNCYKYYLREI